MLLHELRILSCRDLVQEPKEVITARQQQEILQDLVADLAHVNNTLRRIIRDEGGLDLDRIEQRIHQNPGKLNT